MIIYLSAVVILLGSLIYPFAQHLIQGGGILKETTNYQNQDCRVVHRDLHSTSYIPDALLNGCENGQLIPGTHTVLMGNFRISYCQ